MTFTSQICKRTKTWRSQLPESRSEASKSIHARAAPTIGAVSISLRSNSVAARATMPVFTAIRRKRAIPPGFGDALSLMRRRCCVLPVALNWLSISIWTARWSVRCVARASIRVARRITICTSKRRLAEKRGPDFGMQSVDDRLVARLQTGTVHLTEMRPPAELAATGRKYPRPRASPRPRRALSESGFPLRSSRDRRLKP
jgi:hypothetical protein